MMGGIGLEGTTRGGFARRGGSELSGAVWWGKEKRGAGLGRPSRSPSAIRSRHHFIWNHNSAQPQQSDPTVYYCYHYYFPLLFSSFSSSSSSSLRLSPASFLHLHLPLLTPFASNLFSTTAALTLITQAHTHSTTLSSQWTAHRPTKRTSPRWPLLNP